MQVTDYLKLGIARKKIVTSGTHTARSKNGFILLTLSTPTFSLLKLTFDISGDTNYPITIDGNVTIPGVKTLTITAGSALLIDPK